MFPSFQIIKNPKLVRTLMATNSYLGTWDFNEGQDLPFQRQGCRDQSPSTDWSFPFFSFLHTNFNLPFKCWEGVFFVIFPFTLWILFSPFMLVPLSPHPASTCWSQLFDFGLELVTGNWNEHFSPTACEELSLILLSSLGYNPEASGDPLFLIQGRTNPNLGLSWNLLCS